MPFLKYLVLPFLLFFSSTTYLYLAEHATFLSVGVITFSVSLISALWLHIFEKLIPFKKSWNQSTNDFNLDLIYYFLGYLVFFPKKLIVSTFFFLNVKKISFDSFPIVFQILVFLIISDFFLYWYHRSAHSNRYLISLHNIHHSIKKVYFFNSYRGHPFDALCSSLVKSTPLYFIHFSNTATHIALCISISYGLFIHANIDSKIPFFLKYIFFSPLQHFSHHSNKAKETHANYGRIFSCWDYIFKTYQKPQEVLQNPTYSVGSPYKKIPSRAWGQIISVFKL